MSTQALNQEQADKLPPLPKYDIRVTAFGEIEPRNGRTFVMGEFYTADQMREYAIAALDAAQAQPEQPVAWAEAQRICDLPIVDEYIRNLIADHTGDNATCLVLAILEAATVPPASKPAEPSTATSKEGE